MKIIESDNLKNNARSIPIVRQGEEFKLAPSFQRGIGDGKFEEVDSFNFRVEGIALCTITLDRDLELLSDEEYYEDVGSSNLFIMPAGSMEIRLSITEKGVPDITGAFPLKISLLMDSMPYPIARASRFWMRYQGMRYNASSDLEELGPLDPNDWVGANFFEFIDPKDRGLKDLLVPPSPAFFEEARFYIDAGARDITRKLKRLK